MGLYLVASIVVLGVAVALLLVKIHLMQKSAKEIKDAFTERLEMDTNTLIDLSSRDKQMRGLADAINTQLSRMRTERHRYQQGDAQLKLALTNISHDLRTPLTAICGYLDLLEQEELTGNAKRYLAMVKNRSELLKGMTEEFFRYSIVLSAEQKAEEKPVCVNRVLEESIAACYTELNERGITPIVQIPETKVIRTLDAASLSRVFSNLIQNAVKYSDGDLHITLVQTGEVLFENTASHLDEVQVGRLFDRFYTVETAWQSTGLGLSIAKALMEQMHGTISARYEGRQLSIRLFFPE